jgi:hypothetical protein
MGKIDLSRHPCRRSIFDVFEIDKSETDIKVIRAASQKAREQLKFAKIVARDGTELSLTEADLNEMDKILLDPVARLKAEQFVHQAHSFSQDEKLAALMRQLEEVCDPLPGLLAEIQAGALASLARKVLPQSVPPPLEDDLPPVVIEPLELQLESLRDSILREC